MLSWHPHEFKTQSGRGRRPRCAPSTCAFRIVSLPAWLHLPPITPISGVSYLHSRACVILSVRSIKRTGYCLAAAPAGIVEIAYVIAELESALELRRKQECSDDFWRTLATSAEELGNGDRRELLFGKHGAKARTGGASVGGCCLGRAETAS